MEKFISLIIPNYNGGPTIGKCLEAAFASRYGNFEVVVVDDCSTDGSVEIIRRYPCRLVRLGRHSGASAARNAGAADSKGDIFMFIDADCLVREDALALANEAAAEHPGAVIGGTYTPLPYDADFFSAFQSLFIHHSETKRKEPDYIATHAMIVSAALFKTSGGFPEDFLPILEDVEFSHRLRRAGIRLVMKPEIQVAHVFRFTLARSLANAFRKSRYWTAYSLGNRDLLADSGTASRELKINVVSFFANVFFVLLFFVLHWTGALLPVPFLAAANLVSSRGLFALACRAKGPGFTLLTALYYTAVYPLAVGAGAVAGAAEHVLKRSAKKVTIS